LSKLRVLFRVPSRAWADSAIVDLAADDCAAEVVQGPDCDGCWTVLVTGPAIEVGEMRRSMWLHAAPFCWEAFLRRG
jgi:hypothetical protein